VFLEDGYTKEERKMVDETRKILHAPDLPVTATAVRVPVFAGHSESINAELARPFKLEELTALLAQSPGLVLQDDPARNLYPTPLQAVGRDEVFVGRVRRDFSVENGVNLWVVSDNRRKGAATNAIQIVERGL
jgi:aspartate-semialdehyde dehydrogenase